MDALCPFERANIIAGVALLRQVERCHVDAHETRRRVADASTVEHQLPGWPRALFRPLSGLRHQAPMWFASRRRDQPVPGEAKKIRLRPATRVAAFASIELCHKSSVWGLGAAFVA